MTAQDLETRSETRPAEPPWPRPAESWYAVALLILVFLFALLDRQILTLLVQPIRRDLGLSDTEISLLIGFAFAVFYTLLGIPIARLADRRSRRAIIAVGLVFWSLMTVACGLAKNYAQLFLARVGVGVGEATLQPSAYSMLADYFPPEKLGRAIGTYATGLFLGSGLALVVGGLVIGSLSGEADIVLPLVGAVRPWQVAFFVVGLPGVLLSLVFILTVREPARRGLAAASSDDNVPRPVLLAFMRTNAATLAAIFAAFSFGGIAVVGYLAWIPELVRRSHGWEIADIGLAVGFVMAVFGTAGTLFGGWFLDWLTRRGHVDAALRASLLVFVLLVPFSILPSLMPSAPLCIAALAPLLFLIGMQQGYSPVALQLITPNELRAQITAVYFLVAQVVAMGLGPTAMALMTDFVFRDDAALRWSMAVVGGFACALGSLCLALGRTPYTHSVQRARGWLGRPTGMNPARD